MYCEYLRHNPYLAFEDYVRGFDLAGFAYAAVFDWLFALPRHVARDGDAVRGRPRRRRAGDRRAAARGGLRPRARHRPGRLPRHPLAVLLQRRGTRARRRRSPGGPMPRPRRSSSTCSTRATAASAPPASPRCRRRPPPRSTRATGGTSRLSPGCRPEPPGRGGGAAEPDRRRLDPRRARARPRSRAPGRARRASTIWCWCRSRTPTRALGPALDRLGARPDVTVVRLATTGLSRSRNAALDRRRGARSCSSPTTTSPTRRAPGPASAASSPRTRASTSSSAARSTPTAGRASAPCPAAAADAG